MEDLKTRIQKVMVAKGADLNNFKFKLYKKAPYIKNRFKSEFIESECWIYIKGGKLGYVLTDEDFSFVEYSHPYIDMIIEDCKHFNN